MKVSHKISFAQQKFLVSRMGFKVEQRNMPDVLSIEENKFLQKLQKLNTPNPNSNLSPSHSLRLRISHYFAQRERKCFLLLVLGLIRMRSVITENQ
jgi:hypothetical protein